MESLRRFFKTMNVGMLWLWRLGLGPLMSVWPTVFGRYLVITHTGRKSGLARRTSLQQKPVVRGCERAQLGVGIVLSDAIEDRGYLIGVRRPLELHESYDGRGPEIAVL